MSNQNQSTITVPASSFRKGLRMAKHAVSKSETRINIKTAHIVAHKGKGVIEATDGHRAVRYTFKANGKGFDTVLPLDDWKSLLDQCPRKGDYTFPDPATGMKFPDLDQFWPKHDRLAIVDGAEFTAAIKAACKMFSEREKPVCLSMRGDAIAIDTEPTDGDFRSVLKAERTDAGEYRMGFNAAYILQFLQAVPKGGKITMEFTGPLNPVVFRSDLAPEYAEVVMPLRIEWKGNYPEQPSTVQPVQADPPQTVTPEENHEPELDELTGVVFTERETVTPQDAETISGPALVMADYSKKAIIITGETYPHRERIKNAVPKAHGIWHRKAEGWIFSKKHTLKLQKALSDLLAA